MVEEFRRVTQTIEFRRGQIWRTESGMERTITSIDETAAYLWYRGGKTGAYEGCCNFSSFQTWIQGSSACLVQPEIETKVQCNSETEKECTQPWHMDDGIPYCDACGYYRSTIHRQECENARHRR